MRRLQLLMAGLAIILLVSCSSTQSTAMPDLYFKAEPFLVNGYWNEMRKGSITSAELVENTLSIDYENDGFVSTIQIQPLYQRFDLSIYSQLQFSGVEEDEGPIGLIKMETSAESTSRPLAGLMLIGDNLGSGYSLLSGLTISDISEKGIILKTASEERLIRIGEIDAIAVADRIYTVYLMHTFIPGEITDNDIEDRARKSCDVIVVSHDYE